MKTIGWIIICAGTSLAAGCATAPSAISPPPATDQAAIKRDLVRTRAVENAQLAASQGRRAEALWQRRVAEALGPNSQAAAEIKAIEARQRQDAEAAFREGETHRSAKRIAAARSAYALALEHQPTHVGARRALNALDRDALLAAIVRAGGGGPAATRN